MTPRFILDEDVIILAQMGTDHRGNPSTACFDLLAEIVRICHPILVDDVLWARYLHQLNQPEHQGPGTDPQFRFILRNALRIPDKISGHGHTAPPFTEEDTIPAGSQDDAYLVRIAVETRAILVTTDIPLRDDLTQAGIQSEYGPHAHVARRGLGLCTQRRICTRHYHHPPRIC